MAFLGSPKDVVRMQVTAMIVRLVKTLVVMILAMGNATMNGIALSADGMEVTASNFMSYIPVAVFQIRR